jgi:hypothetical protein
MSPTPASSLHAYSRQLPRSRRPRNANLYDAAHNTRPVTRPTPPPQSATPASDPTLDEGDDEEDDTQEMDDADVADITEEIDDGNGDGEGAIEEGESPSVQAEQPRPIIQSPESWCLRLAYCDAIPALSGNP